MIFEDHHTDSASLQNRIDGMMQGECSISSPDVKINLIDFCW